MMRHYLFKSYIQVMFTVLTGTTMVGKRVKSMKVTKAVINKKPKKTKIDLL